MNQARRISCLVIISPVLCRLSYPNQLKWWMVLFGHSHWMVKEGEKLAKTRTLALRYFQYHLWLLRQGSGKRPRGPKAESMDVMSKRKGTSCCYGQSHPFSFIHYDSLVHAAHCQELVRTKRFVCLAAVVCSHWCVLVIKLFVSKQKACYALIHRILNLVWSQRNNLLCGTEWPVQL